MIPLEAREGGGRMGKTSRGKTSRHRSSQTTFAQPITDDVRKWFASLDCVSKGKAFMKDDRKQPKAARRAVRLGSV
jgi:hypothetical protein